MGISTAAVEMVFSMQPRSFITATLGQINKSYLTSRESSPYTVPAKMVNVVFGAALRLSVFLLINAPFQTLQMGFEYQTIGLCFPQTRL